MNEVLKVNYDNDAPTVSGRELHGALSATERYSAWFKRMSKYGFTEGIDYLGCKILTPKQDKNCKITN